MSVSGVVGFFKRICLFSYAVVSAFIIIFILTYQIYDKRFGLCFALNSIKEKFCYVARMVFIENYYWVIWVVLLTYVVAFFLRRHTGMSGLNSNSPLRDLDVMRNLLSEPWLPIPSGQKLIIDFGGTGQFKEGPPVIKGVQCSVQYISYEYKYAHDVDLRCIPEGVAEVCIMSGVVEYLEEQDLELVLSMARHILKPSGAIIIFEGAFDIIPLIERPFAWLMGCIATSLFAHPIRYRMPGTIETALEAAGFQNIEVRRRFYAPCRRVGSASHLIRAVK